MNQKKLKQHIDLECNLIMMYKLKHNPLSENDLALQYMSTKL